ncbi:MAG TPA: zinc-dependent metalloprotease family protein [Kiritimatiellia bacterium]|nr:zinc-dependent metalloprotease family protein [Kiritimatiellia bacterium]HRZ12056.1 zinc-dependent metalloprotease family protein [Kiritimatiellia bacterium]HSA19613.1 zinc-dependent metalloprotease family protein [Kiritimatiellia bacterium]
MDARGRALAKLESIQFHRNDLRSMRADRNGGIFYVCDFGGMPAAEPGRSAEPGAMSLDSTRDILASISVTNPPAYSSKPGSTNVLFLDFNGHVVSNTMWNTAYTQTVWNTTPFDTDGDNTTFSDLEQRYIRQIWERVAEDYAPFDINVTTVQPPLWHRRTGHALITPTTDAGGKRCPHYGYGGIAYVDVFNYASYSYNAAGCYSPAWITIMSGDSYANTAEAAAHELGHNMGLSHDGTSTQEYYNGHAATTNAASWGPIMGTGYGRNLSQWSKGEYYDANQPEDDLAIISAKLTYKTDDHGSNSASATPVTVDGLSVTATGLVGRTSDRDVYSMTSGAGVVALSVIPYRCTNGTWGSNSDLVLLLCSSNGTVLASNNIAAAAQASITQSVTYGTYYAHVYPSDAGAPTNTTRSGYTAYGSLGAYALTGQVAVLGEEAPVFDPRGTQTATTGVALAFTVSASGYPAPVLALRSATASSGYSFTPATGELNYTPPLADVGARSFTFTASNSAGVATQVVGVTVVEGPPAAPAAIWASETNAAGFTAAWTAVPGATSYRLDAGMCEDFVDLGGGVLLNEDFQAWNGSTWTNGWTQNSAAQYSSGGVTNSRCVGMNGAGDWILAPACTNPGVLSFYIRTSTDPGNWTAVVQTSSNGTDWIDRASIVESGTGGTIDNTPYQTNIPLNLAGTQYVRWYMTARSQDSCYIDEVQVTRMESAGPCYLPDYSNRVVSGTSQAVTGLTPSATYYFRARAVSPGGTGVYSSVANVTLPEPAATNQLIVSSLCGNPDPVVGVNWFTSGTWVSAAVGGSPWVSGQTQYVCAGWTGTGSVPSSGSLTNTSFSLTNNSTLTWRWTTNFYFARTAGTNGAVLGPASDWYPFGASVTVTAAPAEHYCFAGWGGDTQGDTNLTVMTVSLDRPRQVLASFVEIMAACGTPEPWLAAFYPATNDYDAAELTDTDEDGLSAWKEYVAGTDPTDPDSGLELAPAAPVGNQVVVAWPAISGRYYSVYYLTNLAGSVEQPVIENWRAGQTGPASSTNAIAPDVLKRYYRLKVSLE